MQGGTSIDNIDFFTVCYIELIRVLADNTNIKTNTISKKENSDFGET